MNISKLREFVKAIRTQNHNSINNSTTTYGEVVIKCWKQICENHKTNGLQTGSLTGLYIYIESLKISCIQRLPVGHSKNHVEKLIDRFESHFKPENFPTQALNFINSRIPILSQLEEDLEYLEILDTESYVEIGNISKAISELSSLKTTILQSKIIEDKQKQVISACIELCERAADNIGTYGMDRFREEISCSYGRISLEIKSVNPTLKDKIKEISTVAEKILAIIELLELGGKALGLLSYEPSIAGYITHQK